MATPNASDPLIGEEQRNRGETPLRLFGPEFVQHAVATGVDPSGDGLAMNA